jgi:hypothetical protein
MKEQVGFAITQTYTLPYINGKSNNHQIGTFDKDSKSMQPLKL